MQLRINIQEQECVLTAASRTEEKRESDAMIALQVRLQLVFHM